jgi:hypothetical protein
MTNTAYTEQFREFLLSEQAKVMMRRALQKMIQDDPEMRSLLARIRLECNLRGMRILYSVVMTVGSLLSILASMNEKNSLFSDLLISW